MSAGKVSKHYIWGRFELFSFVTGLSDRKLVGGWQDMLGTSLVFVASIGWPLEGEVKIYFNEKFGLCGQ